MSITQQKFREVVFQLLYSESFTPIFMEEDFSLFMSHHSVTKKNILMAEEKKGKIVQKLAEIDQKIAAASSAYDFSRIPQVEKNILRLAVFEMCYEGEDIPPKVAIAEAVRLCCKFATEEASSFVNAILDTIYKNSEIKPTCAQESLSCP